MENKQISNLLRLFVVGVVSAAISGFLATPAEARVNVLNNPSFEQGGAGWKIRGRINFVPYHEDQLDLNFSVAGETWGAFNKHHGVSLYQDKGSGGTPLAMHGSAHITAQNQEATGQLCIWVLGGPALESPSKCTSYSVKKGELKEISVKNEAKPKSGGIKRDYNYIYRFEFYPDKGTTMVAEALMVPLI